MPDTLPMRLKTVGLQPIVPTFNQYEYKPEDLSIMERSLANLEARKEKASQVRAAIDTTLAPLKAKMNKAEDKFMEDYTKQISEDIDAAMASGDYGAAIRQGTLSAASIVNDPRVQGRIKAQEEYDKKIASLQARVDAGKVNRLTLNRILAENPYKYSDVTDTNGDVIGGNYDFSGITAYDKIDIPTMAFQALKMNTPVKGSSAGSTTSSGGDISGVRNGLPYSADNVPQTGETLHTGQGYDNSWENVTPQRINEVLIQLATRTDVRNAIRQDYDDALWELQEKEKQLENLDPTTQEYRNLQDEISLLSQDMYINGSPVDYMDWYTNKIYNDTYGTHLSYDWRFSKTTNSYDLVGTTTKPRGGGGGTDESILLQGFTPKTNTSGPGVNKYGDSDNPSYATKAVRNNSENEERVAKANSLFNG